MAEVVSCHVMSPCLTPKMYTVHFTHTVLRLAHKTSVHRRLAYQTAAQKLHPRRTEQRLDPQTFEGLSYEWTKKIMPSDVLLHRYEQHRRWVVDGGGIQRKRFWGVKRYFQRCFKVCRWSWARVLDSQGLDILDYPVAGVFPARTGDIDADQVLIQETYVPP